MEYHEVVREGRDEATGWLYHIKAVVNSETTTSWSQYTNSEHAALRVDYEERQVDGIHQYDLQLSGGICEKERQPFARALESVGVPPVVCAQTAAFIFDVIYPVGRMSRLLDDDSLYLDTDAFVEILIETEDDDDLMEMETLRPARRDAVEALEKVRVGSVATGCVVCMDEISAGSEVIKMPCAHLFHGECILTWLHNSSSCPLCRYTLPSAVEESVWTLYMFP